MCLERRDPARQTTTRPGGRRITDLTQHSGHVTVGAIADYLGVDSRTVWKWITAGSLPAYQFSDRIVRINPQELHAFLERHRLEPPA